MTISTADTLLNQKLFWQKWQKHKNYLYYCCLKWMGGNPTDAEDALSCALLKAWQKNQQYENNISNFKGWLTKLTYHVCIDFYRERDRAFRLVENLELIPKEKILVTVENKPIEILETEEKEKMIRDAIEHLPTRLRQTYLLHFEQQLSHDEIAQQQEISYDNVCKRISQARKLLGETLWEYFCAERDRAS
jgi:RNA polymerase sigma factor (sigma-70 family)